MDRYFHIQIFCYKQSPHPPSLFTKDAVGCEAKQKYTLLRELLRETGQLPLQQNSETKIHMAKRAAKRDRSAAKRDRSAAPLFLLAPLCCSLLEQLSDSRQCLDEQDQ